MDDALAQGYLIALHVVMVPEDLAVARVVNRIDRGGHSVPEDKIRGRYHRLWPLVATAVRRVERAAMYDNSRAAHPFRLVASFEHGAPLDEPDWPAWTPDALRGLNQRV